MITSLSNFAFIDSQNLHLGVTSQGWHLDYRKFRLYLKNKFDVARAYLFIGFIPNNQDLYTSLQKAGYILIFKPTISYLKDGKQTVKGNVDAELVLHAAAIEYPNYNQAVLVTGDGDFACLADYLVKNNKLLCILAPNGKYSKLLKKHSSLIVCIDQLKNSLSNKKTSISGRSKP
jgi:uncharacterized LabA/DUF88 family protein